MGRPGRVRKAGHIGMSLVAVASIGWCGYDVWSNLSARRAIDSACAGLVPVGTVLRLPDGGGRIEADGDGMEMEGASGACSVRSTDAGDSYGLNRGEGARSFFEGSVSVEPNSSRTEPDDLNLVESADRPSVETPLGGGIPGMLSDSGVAVRLACGGEARHDGRPVTHVSASAVSANDGFHPLATGSPMPQKTRDLLVAAAVDMANRAAERVGCKGRLPEPSDGVEAASTRFQKPEAAKGTCASYGRRGPDRSSAWLPDQVLETPTDSRVWTERCGLVVSRQQALRGLSAQAVTTR